MSPGEMPMMLPKMMVFSATRLGKIEMSRMPRAKKEVKTMPMTASSRTGVFILTKAIAAAARSPLVKAPTAKGRPAR